MRDFKRLQKDPPDGISGAPCDNDILKWNAVIFGSVPPALPFFPLALLSPRSLFLSHPMALYSRLSSPTTSRLESACDVLCGWHRGLARDGAVLVAILQGSTATLLWQRRIGLPPLFLC